MMSHSGVLLFKVQSRALCFMCAHACSCTFLFDCGHILLKMKVNSSFEYQCVSVHVCVSHYLHCVILTRLPTSSHVPAAFLLTCAHSYIMPLSRVCVRATVTSD